MFYLLDKTPIEARDYLACRLVNKAWQQGFSIYLHCIDLEVAARLDDLLWTFRDISFIPHALTTDDLKSPVCIGWEENPIPTYEVLINLTDSMPHFFEKFQRIVEIVPNEPHAKSTARQKYKTYQKVGCELQTHVAK